jgi:serine/threonine-protein kinase
MAALYLGRRQGAGGFTKDLAIKVIHTHLSSDKSFVEMFVDEARLSARIDHPNVVRVEALKQHKDSYCLLMEFVHGTSLSQLMGTLKKRDMRFSPELAVAIAIRVADGLHAAHELLNPDGTAAGVVHRDVSPANVLVGYRGDVKLIDFGIAKATQRLHQTEAAGLKGKIAYMSPEQAFGRDVDRRTDVYALGIVLWEMLTMRRLFKADNDLRLLDMVRDPKIVPPGALLPDLPPALDRVIFETLAGDRERRPATCRDFRYRLLDALPSAAAIDPLQISAVVCDIMSDKIMEDREVLSISSFNSLPTPSEKESVTVSRLLRPASPDDISIDEMAHSAHDLADAMGGVALGDRAAPPTLLPQTSGLMTPPSLAARAPRKRKMLPLVLGVAASLGLAAGGAAGLVYAFLNNDGDAQGEAVTLPPGDDITHTVASAGPPEAAVDPTVGQPVPERPDGAQAAVAPDSITADETIAPTTPVAPRRGRGRGRRPNRHGNEGGTVAQTPVQPVAEPAGSGGSGGGSSSSGGGQARRIREIETGRPLF